MPRKPAVSVKTTATQEVALDQRTAALIRVQLYEYAEIQRQVNELEKKKVAIRDKVQQQFVDSDQVDALVDGTDVDGYKVKLVSGTQKKFDKTRFMKKHGLTEKDFAAFTKEVPKKSYVKITPPGEEKDEEE